jgi:inner membrane protein
LYNAKLNINGDFLFTSFDNLNIIEENILWKDSFISVGIRDMTGIKESVELEWNGEKFLFEPGTKNKDIFDSGVSIKVPISQDKVKNNKFIFFLNLDLNGSEELNFLPFGKKTTVQLSSKWNDPSFGGGFLPEERNITNDGFVAKWKILDLNRNYPQQWTENIDRSYIDASKFGVKLFTPVDEYTKTNRSIKYSIMFISLTFLVFFFVEILNKKRMHPIQYLLVGFALCLFYLLLLSISEHLNFDSAYLIASISTIILITFYTKSVLKENIFILMGVVLIILYVFLYILLQNEEYSLLMGSIGLFIILAVVMYFSRKIDWYKIDLGKE